MKQDASESGEQTEGMDAGRTGLSLEWSVYVSVCASTEK